jgi:cathepsin L
MLSIIKALVLSLGAIYNSTYDNINGTFYPNHTEYITYIKQHNKTYNYNNYLIFKDNIDYIEDMNSKNLSYNLEINWLSDYKINSRMNINKRTECNNCYELTDDIIPESIDWREKNAVTHVKNQGNCGSCWSFSSTGSVEGAWAIKNNQLYNLSEQMLMDCSDDYGNKGCQGGLMDNAFKYIIDNGLCDERGYPYGGDHERCQSAQCNRVVHISDYSDVRENDEKVLKRAVAQQPISVAIQANLSSLHFYKAGIYQDPECGDGLDHGVLIVGYGHDLFRGLDYWIIKNSWGDTWGEKGYFKMLRNYKGSDSGMCGIALQPSFPTV